MSAPQLLVVEDDPAWQERLGQTARSEGYEVTLALDGREALSYLGDVRRARPDLVLLDLMLPHVDGWELYGRMRMQARLRDIPVLMISVASLPVDLEGVVAFLHKSVSPELVLAELRKCLRGLGGLAPLAEYASAYALHLTEEAHFSLGTLPPYLRHTVRQHLLRAAELAGTELPLMSTWLMALPGTPPSLLVSAEGVRVVLEVDEPARTLTTSTVIIPPYLLPS